jgi:anti-sigma-K factor RskA
VTTPSGPVSDHPLDDLAAYALDALDDTERRAVDEHLAHCAECRGELAGHHETLASLAADESPPASVWQRIAAGIGAPGLADPHGDEPGERQPPLALAPDPVAPERSGDGPAGGATGGRASVSSFERGAHARAHRSAPPRWLGAVAGLVAAAAVGGLLGFALGDSRGDDTDIGGLAQQAAEAPNGVLATLADSDGQAVARIVADDDGAYVLLENLEDLPEGRAYQLWSLTESDPVSLGMLGRDGTNTVAFRLPPTITELAISEAPTSGDAAPVGGFRASGSVVRTS